MAANPAQPDPRVTPPDAYPDAYRLTPDEPIDLGRVRPLTREVVSSLYGRLLEGWPAHVSVGAVERLEAGGVRVPALWGAFDHLEEEVLFNDQRRPMWIKLLDPLALFAVQMLSWEVYVLLWRQAATGVTQVHPHDVRLDAVVASLVERYGDIAREEPAVALVLDTLDPRTADKDWQGPRNDDGGEDGPGPFGRESDSDAGGDGE